MVMLEGERFRFDGQVDHNTERGVFNEDGRFDTYNEALAHEIALHLEKHYPGQPWAISAEIEHGIVRVGLQGFLQWWYVIHVETLKTDPHLASVTRAGGELLERLQIPRGNFSMADWLKATHRYPEHRQRNRKAPE